MSVRDEENETRVERAGSRWLVTTSATEILMSYDHHDTATKLTLPNQTVFLTVPQGAMVHSDDMILQSSQPRST